MALVQELAPATDEGGQQEARGIVLGWVQSNSHRRVQELAEIWEEFVDQKRFW